MNGSSVFSGSTVRPAAPRRCRVLLPVLLVCLVLLSGSVEARAQSATLSGKVTDRSDGSALELVTVVLMRDGALARGTVTNRDGLFVIPRIEPGRYALRVSFVGYDDHTDTLDFDAGEVRAVEVVLRPEEQALDEVVVEGRRTVGAARTTAGQQTIRPSEIEMLPAPDLSPDLATYLSAMPGVVTTGDRGGQLFIRGGEPSQNLILLDGIPLFQPFHLLGFYSAFPADIIDRTDVYAGGFGTQYGDRLSSVVDVASRNGHGLRHTGAVSLSPFISSARVEGPIFSDRATFLASARQSMIEPSAPFVVGRPLPFVFGDFFAKLHVEPGTRSRISATALHTYDRGTLGETVGGATAEEVRWQNQAVGLRALTLPRIYPVIADLHVSISRLLSEVGPPGEPARSSEVQDVRVALDATFPGQRTVVYAGWTMDLLRFQSELGGLYQNLELRASRLDHLALYLEPEITFGGFSVRPGARLQFYFARGKPILEPRLRVVWRRGIHQLSGATGVYLQEVVGVSDRRDAASVFTVWTNTPKTTDPVDEALAGRLPRAVHAIAGYRVGPAPWLDLSVEGFYKHLSGLFVAEWTAFPRLTSRLQPATGRSLGFDARLEVRRGPFYGLVSYGLSSTRYAAEQAALQLWYGVERLRFRPPHDRRHQLNVVASTSYRRFDLSLRWAFGSGLPFSRVLGFDGFVLMDGVSDVRRDPGRRRVIYERPFEGILPTYHRLDVSVARTFPLGAADLSIQASVVNLYDRRNLFYLDTFTFERVDQLPFVPSLGIRLSFD